MKTIQTIYYGPTDHKPARLKATDNDGNTLWMPYPSALNMESAHMTAAKALKKKMDWPGYMHGGHHKNGMIWVFIGHYVIA